MIIKQLQIGHGANFTYIIGCETTRDALVIDPGSDIQHILHEAEKANLTIKYIVNTHGHGDHTVGNLALKEETGATIFIHADDGDRFPQADQFLKDETVFRVGHIELQIIHTPGHTPGGICLYAEGNLFTGDTLFVGDSGRTDLPGGNRPTLGASIRKLMQLPNDTIVWPGHHYGPKKSSTLAWEKRHNVNAREYGFYQF